MFISIIFYYSSVLCICVHVYIHKHAHMQAYTNICMMFGEYQYAVDFFHWNLSPEASLFPRMVRWMATAQRIASHPESPG